MQGVENEFMKWCLAVHVDVYCLCAFTSVCVTERERRVGRADREHIQSMKEFVLDSIYSKFLIQNFSLKFRISSIWKSDSFSNRL